MAGRTWNDEKVERIIGTLLRIGVSVSAAVVFLGALVYLVRNGSAVPAYGTFQGEPADLTALKGIADAALSFSGRGIIQFGLVLLMLTPVARVAFSIAAFALEHDRLYVIIASIVLAVLAYSMLGG